MGDAGDDGWHVVPGTEYFEPAADFQAREQIQQWGKTFGHWSGSGKHIKSERDIKFKLRADEVLGYGATGLVERVTIRSVTMARKRIRIRGLVVEQLREEANIMEKMVHKHIVELVGTYSKGPKELCILTYPAATCNLQSFLDDIEEVRTGNSAELKDSSNRFEALGFRGVLNSQGLNEDPQTKALEGPLSYLSSILGCVTDAVDYIHKNKVRHQDLKPKNILLSPQKVYLADFGISRDLKDATHSLTEGFPGGTLTCLAPEVVENKPHYMSPADIYSLGCVFLSAASVLYGAPHGQCENVLSGKDLVAKSANLRAYLADLKIRALATGKAAHCAATCGPKHLVSLIETMMARDPTTRPTASQVKSSLHEIGGIDQIYYGKCCKKETAFVSQLIDNKLLLAAQEQASQAARILQLEAQHEADQLKISSISKAQETYKHLIERERDHIVDQWKMLLEQQSKKLEIANTARKSLEAQLNQLKNGRHFPRKGSGRFAQFNVAPAGMPAPPDFNQLKQRNSRIPLPERPTTPLNPSPPHRPGWTREPSSGNSTLQSSVESMYSRTTVVTNGSNHSDKSYRSSTPDSPVVEKIPLSPVLSHKDAHEEKSDTKSVTSTGESADGNLARKSVMTWAEMARLHLEGQKTLVHLLPSPVQPRTKTPAIWRASSAL